MEGSRRATSVYERCRSVFPLTTSRRLQHSRAPCIRSRDVHLPTLPSKLGVRLVPCIKTIDGPHLRLDASCSVRALCTREMREYRAPMDMVEWQYATCIEQCIFDPRTVILEDFIVSVDLNSLLIPVDTQRSALHCQSVECFIFDDCVEKAHVELIPVVYGTNVRCETRTHSPVYDSQIKAKLFAMTPITPAPCKARTASSREDPLPKPSSATLL